MGRPRPLRVVAPTVFACVAGCYDPGASSPEEPGATDLSGSSAADPGSSAGDGSTASFDEPTDSGTQPASSGSTSGDGPPVDDGSDSTLAGTTEGSEGDSSGGADPCGDGVVERDEQCDDANDAAGDGCSECVVERDWSCGGSPSVCSATPCDPLLQDCGIDEGCYPLTPTWACAPADSGPDGGQGEACEAFDECSAGHVCLGTGFLPDCAGPRGCCTSLCDLSRPSATCPNGLECEPWYEDGLAPPGLENVGVCL
jgi:cysteine-rich repeat protein